LFGSHKTQELKPARSYNFAPIMHSPKNRCRTKLLLPEACWLFPHANQTIGENLLSVNSTFFTGLTCLKLVQLCLAWRGCWCC